MQAGTVGIGGRVVTVDTPQTSRTLLDLRREFDLAFAALPRTETLEFENLVAIRVGSAPYAVRLSAITDLLTNKRITALPNAPPELLGIAGFRGEIFPVYDLRALLGQPVNGNPRWMILAGRMLAFVFDGVDGCIRVPQNTILPAGEAAARHIREVVHTDTIRPIVSFSSIQESILEQAGSARFQKE